MMYDKESHHCVNTNDVPTLSELLASHSELTFLFSSIFQRFEEIALHLPNSATGSLLISVVTSLHPKHRCEMPKESRCLLGKPIYSCKQLLVVIRIKDMH